MDKIINDIKSYIAKEDYNKALELIYTYQNNAEVLLLFSDIFDDLNEDVRAKFPYHNVYEIILKSSIKGNLKAMVRLGDMYRKGNRYCSQNGKKAFEWYSKSYQGGNIHALDCLIECYQNGIGVEVNTEIVEQLKKEIN